MVIAPAGRYQSALHARSHHDRHAGRLSAVDHEQSQHLRTSELDASFQRTVPFLQSFSPGFAIARKPALGENPADAYQRRCVNTLAPDDKLALTETSSNLS